MFRAHLPRGNLEMYMYSRIEGSWCVEAWVLRMAARHVAGSVEVHAVVPRGNAVSRG